MKHIKDGDRKIIVQIGNQNKHLNTANFEVIQLSKIYDIKHYAG